MNEIKRLYHAFLFSLAGIKATWTTEPAFRFEIVMAILLTPIVFILDFSQMQKVVLLSAELLVLIAELANTAIEATVDRVSLERHELAKKAKDAGSAVVLLSMINFLIVWGMILGPELITFLQGY